MPHRGEGLHLCEHDSTVWVHFCLLESVMLWPICALSLCMYGSMGEERLRASRSTMSRLFISVWLGVMWCFVGLGLTRTAEGR